MTDAITIQNPRNRGGSTGHVLAKRSVTFTEIRNEEEVLGLIVEKMKRLMTFENELRTQVGQHTEA